MCARFFFIFLRFYSAAVGEKHVFFFREREYAIETEWSTSAACISALLFDFDVRSVFKVEFKYIFMQQATAVMTC